MTRILLVEDDREIARFITRGLQAEGYTVDAAFDGREALELARRQDYPLIILDRMLPYVDGLEVCRMLRQERRDGMVIMLTAKDRLEDKLEGLRGGADDYLTKPFAFDELLARLEALQRRKQAEPVEPVLQVGDLILDPAVRLARRGDREIELTVKEFALLKYLMTNAGRAVSRARILDAVWQYTFEPGTNVVDVCIRRLRQKVDDGETVRLIRTSRGYGYVIAAP